MDTKSIKEKLHDYIDKATEEELEEMLFIVEEDDVEYEVKGISRNWWEDKDLVKELERRTDEIESGEVQGIPAKEVSIEIKDMLDNMKK